MTRLSILFFLLVPSLAMGEDLGVNNQQYVNKPAGDPSIVQQNTSPSSHDNLQSATVQSSGGAPNQTIQSVDGSGNVQTSVQNGGSGNVVIQTQHGSGNRQTVIQTGNGNKAIQIQSGDNHTGTLDQHGGKSDVQIQN